MSAPNPKFTDDEPRELPRCVRAFGPVREITAIERVPVDLDALTHELTRNRTAEIAALMRELTYGEMIELAEAIWSIGKTFDQPLDLGALPMILHRWSNQ